MSWGEIYNTSWWGVALDTARTVKARPDFFGSQLNLLTSEQPNLVTNGNFDTDSDWTLGTGWSIGDGVAVATNAADGERLRQDDVFIAGKIYKVTYEITEISQGGFRGYVGGTNLTIRSAVGVYTETLVAPSIDVFYIKTIGTTTGSIDNVSVQLVRAELDQIEAKKCLADWIHTTALKDLNN